MPVSPNIFDLDTHFSPWEFALAEEMRTNLSVELILGSASARRRHLFAAFGLPFRCQGAEIAEDQRPGEPEEDFALRLAFEKAEAVARQNPSAWVLGADTLVAGMGVILGKPQHPAQAVDMLGLLSGRTHRVLTGVALCGLESGLRQGWVETTKVSFRHLKWAEIEDYLKSGEPLDKAGAYGIQGAAGAFVRRVEGSYTNVVGLPMESLKRVLEKLLASARALKSGLSL
jgi:septum formation protein